MSIIRPLSREEKKFFSRPYPTINSRKAIRQWPKEIPICGKPSDVHSIVKNYGDWLTRTTIPKLFFYAEPGAIIDQKAAEWIKNNFPVITSICIGKGIHYLQEDHPQKIGKALKTWYLSLS